MTYDADLDLNPSTQRPDLQQHIMQQARAQVQRFRHLPTGNRLHSQPTV